MGVQPAPGHLLGFLGQGSGPGGCQRGLLQPWVLVVTGGFLISSLKYPRTREGGVCGIGTAWASHLKVRLLGDRLWVVGAGLGPALAQLVFPTL